MKSKLFYHINILLTFSLFTISPFRVLSQFELMVPIISKEINQPVSVSKDRAGFIYYADTKGDVHKLDQSLNEVAVFSPNQPGQIHLIESWSALKIFIFYKDFQQFLFLDRFLNSTTRYNINSNRPGYYSLLSPSEDNKLWAVDAENLNLLKYDYSTEQVQLQTSLKNFILTEDNQLTFIRAYHQQVFISDLSNGILVFDNFGNYIKRLPYPDISYFNFNGNDMYFLTKNKLIKVDLYSLKEKEIVLPGQMPYSHALIDKDKITLFSKSQISVFSTKKP